MGNPKIGILGGGQLGKMMGMAARNWPVDIHILDKQSDYPASRACDHFVEGDFKNYQDVYQFGLTVDVVTVEIEHVNTKALHDLEAAGVPVYPSPKALDTIKDKGLQKQFYFKHELPTAPFELFSDAAAIREAIQAGKWKIPFVQKSRTAGYDGKGVAIIRNEQDLTEKLLEGPSVIEPLVDIDKELAVQVARSPRGEVKAFPVVEMLFHPTANLVEFLQCPSDITEEVAQKATEIAIATTEALNIVGLLSVEFFLTKSGEVIINESAPRPHNSGHHTIEANVTSQFDQHLRAVLNWPLGKTNLITPAIMVNLLGADGSSGPVAYEHLQEAYGVEGAFIHLYEKAVSKPFRKMGHATVVDPDLQIAKDKARYIREKLIIKGMD